MIRFNNISKSFNNKKILDDISGEFYSGKINMIIGASGTGKSVLLKSIVGIHNIDGTAADQRGSDLHQVLGQLLQQHRLSS